METEQQSLVQKLSTPLFQAKGWMKFVGVMGIITGALQAITLVGLLWAWLPIWMGVLLMQAGSAIEAAERSGSVEAFTDALAKLKTYFTLMGVTVLIGLAITVLFMLLGGMTLLAGMAGMGGYH
ncbi:MAG: DUF5362 domain-containing protein [Pseudomonadota bacterium]|uniref:DUF5362 domain-containing protein n=1 Tax=Gallaecimonas pentaromativorans TaxID=584787 RepID=UPI00067F328B|nr:DUF5362 domain-containing protein [Gallaecimonas pentaromativorans]MED5526141.1 DUF5362 domain-containing protein [Pseudomonadota bacterium]